MSRYDSLAVFARVADLGSFAAAARDFGLSPAMVGNHVRALEAWFGAPLLLRTTRQQTLTDTGRMVLGWAQALRATMAELDAVAEQGQALGGVLRVAAPLAVGRHHVAPALRAFARVHPGLQIELRLSDGLEDMIKANIDLAVRNGPLLGNEASLVARVVARQELQLAASPAYLARAGMPRSRDELMQHQTIRYSRHGRPRGWLFPGPAGQTVQLDPPTAFMADDVEALRDAALDGAGITWLPDWLLAPRVRDGSLVRVLPALPCQVIETYLVRPAAMAARPKVTQAAEHLAQSLASSMKV